MWRTFKLEQMKGRIRFSKRNNINLAKILENLPLQNRAFGQFQLNLAQIIRGWREFRFVQMRGHTFFYRYSKIYWRNSKIFFSRTTGPIASKLGTNHIGIENWDIILLVFGTEFLLLLLAYSPYPFICFRRYHSSLRINLFQNLSSTVSGSTSQMC